MIGPVTLPWLAKGLSPNTRQHWAKRHNAIRMARHHTAYLVMEVMGRNKLKWSRVKVTYTFHPPDKRRRDLDNLIASTKALGDGISDAIGIDDQYFIPTYSIGAPMKGGAVVVKIESGEE